YHGVELLSGTAVARHEQIDEHGGESRVLEDHVAVEAVLYGVPHPPAVDVPGEQEHDRERSFAYDEPARQGGDRPRQEGYHLGDEERERERTARRDRRSIDPE